MVVVGGWPKRLLSHPKSLFFFFFFWGDLHWDLGLTKMTFSIFSKPSAFLLEFCVFMRSTTVLRLDLRMKTYLHYFYSKSEADLLYRVATVPTLGASPHLYSWGCSLRHWITCCLEQNMQSFFKVLSFLPRYREQCHQNETENKYSDASVMR